MTSAPEWSTCSGREVWSGDGIGLVGDDILPAAIDRFIAAELPDLRLDAEPDIVAGMRSIKSPAEQALMRRAALCADAALMTAIDMIRAGGVTEREVCAEAIAAAMRAGADFVRYFRVHSGPWSALGSRWPQAMDRTIRAGRDRRAGCHWRLSGLSVRRQPDDRLRRAGCRNAPVARHHARCHPGRGRMRRRLAPRSMPSRRRPREVMNASAFGDYFRGMLGHAIGLETVELPYLKTGEQTVLQPGMVLCIEPGLFIPEVAGAAIEQEVIIAESGPPEVITPTPMRLW